MTLRCFNSVNGITILKRTWKSGEGSSMTSAGWFFGMTLAFLGLFFSAAQAEETWEQKALAYLGWKTPATPQSAGPENTALGLKSTLSLCAEHAAFKLGHYDGFASNPKTRIPLPPNFQKARDVLEHFGLSARLDDLELKMNRAAEDATPSLKPLIDQAIEQLTFRDPNKISAGSDGAATIYFRSMTEKKMRESIQPIIEKSLAEAGAQNDLRIISHSLTTLPMSPDLKFDMTAYVSEKTLDGIYLYMAEKEEDIREKPSSTGNETIKQLFLRH
jgi:hypothetical protein